MPAAQEHYKLKGLFLRKLNRLYPYLAASQVLIFIIIYSFSKHIIDYWNILRYSVAFVAAASGTFVVSFFVIYVRKYPEERNLLIKNLILKIFIKSLINTIVLVIIYWAMKYRYY